MDDSMKFLRQHLPYEDGGHVTLRRKMFKLGGDVNTHGVGITSGLAYNTGGSVRQGYGAGAEVLKGGIKGSAWALKKLKDILRGSKEAFTQPGKYISGGRESAEKILKMTGGKGLSAAEKLKLYGKLGFGQQGRGMQGLRALGVGGTYATPPALLSTFFDRMSEEERAEATDLEKFFDKARGATEFASSFNPIMAGIDVAGMAGDTLYEAMQEDPDYLNTWSVPDLLRKYTGISDRATSGTGQAIMDDAYTGGQTDQEIDVKKVDQERKIRQMQETMDMYLALMNRQDQPQTLAGKFFGAPGLGDALISGGSALMEGEGWGPSAEAFNAPLTEARLQREGDESAWKQMAASQAISDISSEDAATQAALAEHLGTGDFDLAEATQKYQYAQGQGVTSIIPTTEKGELDKDAIKDIAVNGGGVFSDITNASGTGKLYISVNTKGRYIATNDIEEAQKYVGS